MTTPEYARVYDRVGERLHRQRTQGALFVDRIERPAVRSLLPSRLDGSAVLDVGCGAGDLSRYAASLGARVVALDVSETMIEMARRESRNQPIEFVNSSLQEFAARTQVKFDFVLASFMLGYFSSLDEFFHHIRCLVSSRGHLVASMLHPFRTRSVRHHGEYRSQNYFLDATYYSDFLGDDAVLPLHTWTFEEVVMAAVRGGFVTEALLEPRPQGEDPADETYRHLPAVAVFEFRPA